VGTHLTCLVRSSIVYWSMFSNVAPNMQSFFFQDSAIGSFGSVISSLAKLLVDEEHAAS
jgi:hypothetical protein